MDMRTIDTLPFDIIVEIFQYLSLEDLVSSVQFVNKNWQGIVQDSVLWKEISFKPCFGLTTEKVVELLEHSPLLRSFEFRAGLNVQKIFDALCEYNPNITSLAFESFEANSNTIEKLIEVFPNLQHLQLPLSVFVNHIPHLGKLRKLKKVKCIQVFYQTSAFDARPHKASFENTDWCALEALELHGEHLSDKFEKLMIHVRGKLTSLVLQTIHSSTFLEHIQHCVNLEKLHLNFMMRTLQDIDFGAFFTGMKNLVNLKYLTISTFVHSDIKIFSKMFNKSKFSKLQELNLSYSNVVCAQVLQSIAFACPQLEIMRLKACVVLDDSCLLEISRCTHLSVLDISGCPRVTEKGLSYLTSCLHLKELNINSIGLVSLPMLNEIAKMKMLRKLYLNHTEINITFLIDAMKQLPHLEFLSVRSSRGIQGEQLQQNLPRCFVLYGKQDLCGILKQMALNIQHLDLCGPDKKVLKALRFCQNLERLSIDFLEKTCYKFPEIFTVIKSFRKLHTLAIRGFAPTKCDVLGHLLSGEELSQLRDLELENCCSVEQDGAVMIASNNLQLENLRLKGCVGLTDEALSALVKIKGLCLLDISGCSTLTETGLLCLSKCKNLTDLNLCGLLSETVNIDVFNIVLSLPKLCKLHLKNNDLLEKYMKSKNWVIVRKSYGGCFATYVPSEIPS